MKLSAKSRYASRILLDLALHENGGLHRVNDISRRTGITVPFIEQIMKPLKQAGLIASKRGAAGGHQLRRAANEITLGEVVRIMESTDSLAACLHNPTLCYRAEVCLTRDAWQRATEAMFKELDTISLAVLSQGRPDCCQLNDD